MEKLGGRPSFWKEIRDHPHLEQKTNRTMISDIRGTAMHMSHSLAMHQMTYQQKGNVDDAVERYLKLREGCYILTMLNKTAGGEEEEDEDMGAMLRRVRKGKGPLIEDNDVDRYFNHEEAVT